METQALKRTLSTVKPELNCHFICWFDLAVPIEDEVQEAKKHCNTNEVVCYHQPGHDFATVHGTGVSEEQNRMDVECVRSYLIDYHGWEEGEE